MNHQSFLERNFLFQTSVRASEEKCSPRGSFVMTSPSFHFPESRRDEEADWAQCLFLSTFYSWASGLKFPSLDKVKGSGSS